MDISVLVLGLVFLPLAAATLSCVLRARVSRALALVSGAGIVLAALGLCLTVYRRGPQAYELGGWGAPLGIELYADGLSALMLLMTALVGTGVSVYAVRYFSGEKGAGSQRAGDSGDVAGSFWALWMFLWAALNGVFLSSDVFNLYVVLELLGLSSVALITLERGRAVLAAGMRYLLVSLFGSLLYLLGVALLYGAYGTLSVKLLGDLVEPGAYSYAALGVIVLGMLLKTALFPLHFWLPPAHANAPTPVSVLLSALVVKGTFYLLLRLWLDVFPPEMTPAAGQLLGVLGAAAIVWGSVLALLQRRLKLLVAYSTVAQVGYLFLLFALLPVAGADLYAYSGGVYHAFSHALAKAAMFMAAGTVMYVLGHDEIAGAHGILRHLPLSVAGFAIAGVTLMGLPPSGGFTAKWLLLVGAVEAGRWDLAAVVALGGLLAAMYVFPFLNRALIQVGPQKPLRPAPRSLEVTTLSLALLSLSLGLVSAPLVELLQVGAPFAAAGGR
ncbi:Formate hydrogenlyase subunit 3/Multisubunit Na+/H+ antiporter MnhD subunit (plasmid) [Rubrobacter radiotolerans]|uniref:Formate hydrogenlyase subunit 3/Multisubunit Na+/H+ antiporter MnhD subunit n=1 Tax=Rubrobacter radiotolerans TaxID=42256 RepID=A0A023X849_RUBRA|nr:proton-conducting transporter membrane subunit [Rubrobacter radiotolerans]AHY48244.1 Formate hydrogenlyase subunit 3/Multisubunit Na+/H+ antiporter MnhD subunit [Rubrobacter radiotolerans]MDX5895276.1 proton-conducting transporter membrane subunit [Rubrobacter radiotolerans]SMC01957.1 Formate hydrogenlyase subunit 3/Multisubunit Na+/H+ antiporter, MnhD subunit [Rubrobacter radiotolerans DSM 5868]